MCTFRPIYRLYYPS